MQKYHVPLLLLWPVLTRLRSAIDTMVWTKFKQDYSYLFVNLSECLTFVSQMALFLWLAFMAKFLLRTLREFLARKYPVFAEESSSQQLPGKKGAVKQLSPREMINTVYYVLDAASILLFLYLAVSYLRLTMKSSSPISYAKFFTNLPMFPYAAKHLLLVVGLVAGALLLLVLLRRFRNSFMCLCQGLLLYGAVNLVCVILVMTLKLDLTTFALWGTLLTTVFLIVNLGYGIFRQIPRFGNMNFANLHPIFPHESLVREQADAQPSVQSAQPEARAETHSEAQTEPQPEIKSEKKSEIEFETNSEIKASLSSVSDAPAAPAPAPAAPVPVETPKKVNTKVPEKAPERPVAAAKPAKPKKAPRRAKGSARKSLQERTGLSFKSLWTIRFTLQMLPYLALFIALVLWVSTAMYTIQPNEQALVYRFGKLQETSVSNPGLHIKFPAPIDKVEIVDVARMRNMYVGYTPAESDNYLWTSEHGGEEYTLLLGNGNELVAVNMRLNYTVDDLMDFRTRYSDPEAMLSSRAYAVMMEHTVNSDLNTVLSVDRGDLSNDVRDALNAYSAEQHLGIHVAEVIIENIHPPVEVAETYQNVVNAAIKQATLTAAADSYAAQTLSAAEQNQTAAVAAAVKDQTEKLAKASSESLVFTAACEAYRQSPDSYALWKLTKAYQQLIAGARLYVFSPETKDEMNRFLLMNGQNTVLVGE